MHHMATRLVVRRVAMVLVAAALDTVKEDELCVPAVTSR
jgi:hypothetical protein